MLKLTVLGCGTSSGVPRIGPDWGACDPEEPRNRRTRASILVESAGTRILVDTGPDMREQLVRAQVNHIDAVLWTHDHADHCHGIDDLRQVAQAMRRTIPGYARRQTLRMLRGRFEYAFEGREPFYPPFVAGQVLPDETFAVGDMLVGTVDQPHGDIFSTGFRFSYNGLSIGYSTDFHDVTADMVGLFRGIDVWVVDALRERPHPTHAHLAQTLAAIDRVRPGRAILTHMDTSMDYRSLAERLPPGVEPGYDGLTITLSRETDASGADG